MSILGRDFRTEMLETALILGHHSLVTVIADDRKRIVLTAAEPGDRFDVQSSGEGTFVLRRLDSHQSPPPKLVKPIPYKGGWLMPGKVDMDKVTEEIVQERQRQDEDLLG
jgi:hypothetical protein